MRLVTCTDAKHGGIATFAATRFSCAFRVQEGTRIVTRDGAWFTVQETVTKVKQMVEEALSSREESGS